MALAWDSKEIRQRWLINQRQGKYLWDIGLRAGYVLLHQIDLILTIFAVSSGAYELNPVMRSLLGSPYQLAIAKLAIPVMIAWLLPSRFMVPAIALLSLIICWNLKELAFFFW